MLWCKVPGIVDKRVNKGEAMYVCRKTIPMRTARELFLSLPSTNISLVFYLTTNFAALVRLVYLISLANRPTARTHGGV